MSVLASANLCNFASNEGTLEVHDLVSGRELRQPDANGRYLIASWVYFWGVWHGTKAEQVIGYVGGMSLEICYLGSRERNRADMKEGQRERSS